VPASPPDPAAEGSGAASSPAPDTAYGGIDPKRLRFFEAAEPLFERFGFRKTTVEDICRAAGVSKRTFYDLFSDKTDLLMQLVEAVCNGMTVAWEATLSAEMSPVDRLHAFLDFYAGMVKEHPFMTVLVEDLDLMRSFGEKTEEIRVSQIGGPLDQLLRDGVAAGQFRPLDPRAALWVVFGLLDTVYLLMPKVMNAPGPLDDPVLAEETKQFIVRGLGAVGAADERG
jgi:AcrR family transcriptional regulator